MSLVIVFVVALSVPAFGHAALTSSTPKDGAKLDAVPDKVEVNYAEPPTTDARFTVTDGCNRDVARSIEVLNQSITADVSSGQPGNWTVEWSVVSAVDGHPTKDSISFSVAGEPDCTQAAADDDTDTSTDSGSDFPIVPIAVATVVILGLAIALRLRSK
jgi:methionine-rich copper-binding protein CopC